MTPSARHSPRRLRIVRGLLLGLLAASVASACALRAFEAFSHAKHLRDQVCGGPGEPECLACTSCHRAGEAHDSRAWAKPQSEVCSRCHQDHEDRSDRIEVPGHSHRHSAAHDIVFDHDRHLDLAEVRGQCITCHDIAKTKPGAGDFPTMATCLGCHEHAQAFDKNECGPCHEPRHLPQLAPKSFLAHDTGWRLRHGESSKTNGQTCALCHTEASCNDCHDTTQAMQSVLRNPSAIERSEPHRFDFSTRHALEARARPGQCLECHATQECDSCHVRAGISASRKDAPNPHGEGWASGAGRAANGHGREARRDLASCAACHDQGAQSNCVRCHAVDGFGGSPHAPGFRSSEPKSAPACAPCHRGRR